MGGIIDGSHKVIFDYDIIIIPSQSVEEGQEMSLISAKSKKVSISKKLESNIVDKMIKANEYFRGSFYEDAIDLLQELIKNNKLLNIFTFQGIGNEQQAYGMFPKNTFLGQKINVFDLISMSFMRTLYFKTKNIEDYISWYESTLQNEQRYQVYFGLGNLYYKINNYIKAESCYKRSLELNKTFAKTYQCLAWIYGHKFSYRSLGFEYAKRSLELNPQKITAKYIFAVCTQSINQKQLLLEQIIKENPDYYRVFIEMGQIEKQKRNIEPAKEYYQKCINIDSDFTQAYLKLGYIQKIQSKRFQIYHKLLDICQQGSALLVLAFIYEQNQRYEQALQLYQKSLRYPSPTLETYSYMASCCFKNEDIEKSIVFLHKKIQINPYDQKSFKKKGILYNMLEKWQEAIKQLQKTIQLNNQDDEFYTFLAQVCIKNHKNEQAMKYFNQALQRNPFNAEAALGLSTCYCKKNDNDMAIQWALKCIQDGCDSKRLVFKKLAQLYLMKKDYQNSFHSLLRYSLETESLNTEYILTNFINQINRSIAIQQIQRQLEKENENELFYAQLGKISLYLQNDKLSKICFSRIQALGEWKELYPCVEELRRRFQGSSIYIKSNYSLGVRSY